MRIALLALLLLSLSCFSQSINIIPQPSQIVFTNGVFNFQKGLSIKTSGESNEVKEMAWVLAEKLFNSAYKIPSAGAGAKNLILQVTESNNSSDEAYKIVISKDSVQIQASGLRGLFYGCQSASQIFINADSTLQLPCAVITDTPKYAYRGMHLDVCRHFFSKAVIEKYIDLMAELKLNVFQWHLTDDQGWRIEIKKYPKLTTVGAWRVEKDGTKYGGFYTQDDIREIVAYAQKRFVTIIPEIELPGHSSAAIAAYPFLSCNPLETKTVPNTWGVKKDIYCPSDSTFEFLKNVLDEVCGLFPGKFIHMGGDEAPKSAWKQSAIAQALIKKEGLKNEEQLQHYFLKKMEDYLATKGKRCIGWGEIVKGGLSDSVIVMSWLDKKAGIAAAKHGNNVIMTPRFYCYFDYPQTIKDKKPAWWMVYLPLKKVYSFNPSVKSFSGEKNRLIMGGQANVWTEYIPDEKRLEHQVMPRLSAMAEALWSHKKDYADFKKRLQTAKVFTAKFPA